MKYKVAITKGTNHSIGTPLTEEISFAAMRNKVLEEQREIELKPSLQTSQ